MQTKRLITRPNLTFILLTKRLFSSQQMTDAQLRKALVRASFVHAKKVGFNDRAIEEACRDFGYTQVTAAVVRNGPIEVVDYAMEFWLERLKEEMTLR